MKQLRIFSLISCFVMILYFLIFSFSDISMAEETPEARIKNCISCCTGKKQICINIKADLRLCEAVFQECIATCNSEGASPSEWSDCWSQSGK
jgi:hypothetical protein